MKSVEILKRAIKVSSQAQIARELGISPQAINKALQAEKISPSIAWALAEKLKEDPKEWALLAAAESERDSAAKSRMLKSIAASVMAAGVISGASATPEIQSSINTLQADQIYIV